VYKRDYAFRMNVMEEIFEIRSCIEILANDIKVNTANEYVTYSKTIIKSLFLVS